MEHMQLCAMQFKDYNKIVTEMQTGDRNEILGFKKNLRFAPFTKTHATAGVGYQEITNVTRMQSQNERHKNVF